MFSEDFLESLFKGTSIRCMLSHSRMCIFIARLFLTHSAFPRSSVMCFMVVLQDPHGRNPDFTWKRESGYPLIIVEIINSYPFWARLRIS